MHTAGYVHRDIKVENCLIDHKLQLYLIDFGLAEAWDAAYETKIIVGTKMYMAPEILDQSDDTNPYKPPCDIWATGVLTFILLSGHFPFYGFEIDEQIKFSFLEFKQDCWQNISTDAKELISMMLQKEPLNRINAERILKNKWFAGLQTAQNIKISSDVLNNMMKYKGASQLKRAAMNLLVKQLNPSLLKDLQD